MDAYRDLYAPDAVLRMPEGWPEPGPYYGLEEAMRQFKQLNDTWSTGDAEPIGDFIDAADRVVVRFIWHGAGRGPEMAMDLTTVFTVRKGKIRGLEFFWDYDEALETLGLAASRENVEVVRLSWNSWLSRHDVDGLLAVYAPDVVWDATHFSEWPEGAYMGHEGIRRFLAEWLEVWDDFEVGVDQILAAPDGRVVALAWQRGKGRHSGLTMDMKWGQVFTLRDEMIVRVENYDNRSEAVAAAGLAE